MERKHGRLAFYGAVLGFGALGLVLRLGLYRLALDEKGLLIPGHPLAVALVLTGVGCLAFALAAGKRLAGSDRFVHNFDPSPAGAAGHGVLAVCLLLTALLQPPLVAGNLGRIWQGLGLAAPVCLVIAARARFQGKPAFFLLHMVLCLYFVFHVVNQYRGWSADPQLLDYLFPLMASISLILFAYYQTAFDVDNGRRRPMLVWGILGIFLCMSSLPGSAEPLVYGGGAVYLATNLCGLTPVPAESPREGGTDHVSA